MVTDSRGTRRLAGKTIVVTGGSSGLGRAMSLAFADHGAAVVIGDLRREPREGGEPTDDLIQARGGASRFQTADVSRGDDIDALVTAAVEIGGRLDVMVCNAVVAGRHSKGLLETDEGDWDAIMDVGLRGVFLCCQRAVRQMLKQGLQNETRGRIINISSQHGMVGTPGHVAYCAAKGGVINLTRQVAVDFAQHGIIVNAIAPGKILTTPLDEPDTEEILAYLTGSDSVPASGSPRGRGVGRGVPGIRREHVHQRQQPARRRRLDGVLIGRHGLTRTPCPARRAGETRHPDRRPESTAINWRTGARRAHGPRPGGCARELHSRRRRRHRERSRRRSACGPARNRPTIRWRESRAGAACGSTC